MLGHASSMDYNGFAVTHWKDRLLSTATCYTALGLTHSLFLSEAPIPHGLFQ